MKKTPIILTAIFVLASITGCLNNSTKKKKMDTYTKGTYGYDKKFLKENLKIVELKKGDAALILVPDYQGRIMTSTCSGDKGFSFGWINYDLIKSKEIKEHFNPFGGEERFWIGPEGGQFSVYFEKDKPFDIKNWYVPKGIDTEAFNLTDISDTKAIFKKKMSLKNYSDTKFDLEVTRRVEILPVSDISKNLGITVEGVSMMGYESANAIKNTGTEAWKKETGLLSIWMLGMLIPSPEVTVVIPVKNEGINNHIPMVNDNYFGKVSPERLKVIKNNVYFKADGKSRGKIGIPPQRAGRFSGSYDAENKTLTILECILPENNNDYVNSAWELQKNPYGGDAINSYNDGPLEDGSQMGPFYELETSSPALALKPNQDYTHLQRTYHFKGDKSELTKISEKILNVSIDEIVKVF